jgi:uncharacterized membrane protein (UPF0182 family)
VTKKGWRLAALAVVLVTVLFVGRWTAGVLADVWWAQTLSAPAARFVTRLHLLRLALEISGIIVASAWFVGHLCAVARAIGSVQVPRQVANLEIQEALTSRTLLGTAIGAGLLLGLLAGSGVGSWWSRVLIAWNGVSYAETEPLLNHDLGLYLAQVPLWRLLQGYGMLLALLALGTVILLYTLIGSVRWAARRLAVSDYARTHLGILLAGCALALSWDYWLRPYELVAGLEGPALDGNFLTQVTVAHVLGVVSLGTAIISAVWAWRPKHRAMLAVWVAFSLTALLGRAIPPLLAGDQSAIVPEATRRRIEGLAYGLNSLKDTAYHAPPTRGILPAPAALWAANQVVRVAAPDSAAVLSAGRAVIPVGGRPRPAWLILHAANNEHTTLSAVADDRTGVLGGALAYQEADTFGYLQPVSRLDLSPRAVRPGAPEYVLDTSGTALSIGSWGRRIALAWTLQAGELLRPLPANAGVLWNLSPMKRLAQLAPFAEWDVPAARLVRDELVWVVDGYLISTTFPLADQVRWRDRVVNSVRAAFVAVIRAETGETRIYLRRTADPLAERWSAITGGLIQPASALPAELQREVWYPEALLRAQATILQGQHWQVGALVGAGAGPTEEPVPPDQVWDADTLGLHFLVPYEDPDHRKIVAVVSGGMIDGWESLRLFRLDSAQALASPLALENRWSRFPTYTQIRDSVRESGGQWKDGAVRYWLGATGLGAYQPAYANSPNGDPSMIWVSLALGDRLGAGRTLNDAYRNLLGLTTPVIATGSLSSQLEEARAWAIRADSALRQGDFVAFGRAFEALKRVLQGGAGRHK